MNGSGRPVGGIEPVNINYCIITQQVFCGVIDSSNLQKVVNKFAFSSLLLVINFTLKKEQTYSLMDCFIINYNTHLVIHKQNFY